MRNKKTRTYNQTVFQDKFMYVPILESIFKSQYVAEMLKSSDTDDSRLRDIHDGSFFKTHPLFSTEKHTVQIQMFYDDFEQILLVPSEVFINTFYLKKLLSKMEFSFGQHTPACLISCTRS